MISLVKTVPRAFGLSLMDPDKPPGISTKTGNLSSALERAAGPRLLQTLMAKTMLVGAPPSDVS